MITPVALSGAGKAHILWNSLAKDVRQEIVGHGIHLLSQFFDPNLVDQRVMSDF